MQRITITVDDELIAALDRVIVTCGYQNRSEAIRDLARAGIAQMEEQTNDAQAGVAALVYVYDHHDRELPKRLTRSSHERHDLSVATMHVHLDHDSCMEVAVLRGAMHDVRLSLGMSSPSAAYVTDASLLCRLNSRIRSMCMALSRPGVISTSAYGRRASKRLVTSAADGDRRDGGREPSG